MQLIDWVKANHLTVWGIIIILGLVMYHQVTYVDKLTSVVNDCNAHYQNYLEVYCPEALGDGLEPQFNISRITVQNSLDLGD